MDIVPTLSISSQADYYDDFVSALISENIEIVRVNMTRYPLQRYVEDLRMIQSKYARSTQGWSPLPRLPSFESY